jgi:uncharacterized membrane protein
MNFNSRYFNFGFISFLIIINVFTKLIYSTEASLYLDEAFSVFHSQQDLTDLWVIFDRAGNPPLYYILLHYWTDLFDISVFSVRSLSFLFNLFMIIGVFGFAKKHLNIFTSIFAPILLSILNFQIHFTQEARVYSLIGFLFILSVWCFFNLFKQPKLKNIIYLAIINSLLLYSHYGTFVIPLSQLTVIAFIFNKVHFVKSLILSLFFTLVISMPSLLMIKFNTIKSSWSWIHSPNFNSILKTLQDFSNEAIGYYFLLYSVVIICIALIVRLFYKKTNILLSLSVLTIGPLIFNYLVSQWVPIFDSKYLFFCQISLWLLAVYLISFIKIPFHIKITFMLGLIVISVLNMKQKSSSEDWKRTVEYAKIKKHEGFDILVSPPYMHMPFSFYYSPTDFKNYKNTITELYKKNVYFIKKINKDLFNFIYPDKILFIEAHKGYIDPAGENIKMLKQFYTLVDTETYSGITAYSFNKN